MEPLSRTERAALCNTALDAGADAPTLCEGWTVKDLVIHLLVRERDPLAAPGDRDLASSSGSTERATRSARGAGLRDAGRAGPQRAAAVVADGVATARPRAQLAWSTSCTTRTSGARSPAGQPAGADRPASSASCSRAASMAGKGLAKPAGVPVEIRWTDRERRALSGPARRATTRSWSPATRPS